MNKPTSKPIAAPGLSDNREVDVAGIDRHTSSDAMAERLARFRAAHPYTRRRFAGETLEYIR